MKIQKHYSVLFGILVNGILSACATSPATRLYLLEPLPIASNASSDTQLTVAVGPIAVPEYLNRKEILTHDERYRVHTAEFDRWAEPLDDSITAVLTENLSRLIPSERVMAYPVSSRLLLDYSVSVRIIAFGTEPGGEVVLNTSWTIHDAGGKPILLSKTRYSDARSRTDTLSTVAAMSRVVGQFSQDIAVALNNASNTRSQ